MTTKVSLDKSKIKFLLLEGVHQSAVDVLHAAGYTNIEYHKKALDGDELKNAIKDAHFIGIRSRTFLTEEVLAHANKLIAIGCFCIGTNQVNLEAAKARGIPVFNAPYAGKYPACGNSDPDRTGRKERQDQRSGRKSLPGLCAG